MIRERARAAFSALHQRRLLGFVLIAATIGVAICVAAIIFLGGNVRREIDALASANSDTTQWALAQVEVETLFLLGAVQDAARAEAPDLIEVRRRFDILYSRVQIVSESRQLLALREIPEARTDIRAMNAFLDRTTPVMDGPDATLAAALGRVEADLRDLRPVARDFSLLGVRMFAAQSDQRRSRVADLLARIGYLTLVLVLTLSGMIAILVEMFLRSLRSEREAADARNRLQDVIATALDGIVTVDAAGRVIHFNEAAERMFGYKNAEATGQSIADLIVPDRLRAAHSHAMARFQRTGRARLVGSGLARTEARRKDGSVFPVELSLSSTRWAEREIFVAFVRDISDRVAAERELIGARDQAVAGEKAKAELLAVMSHEMRNPLNGLLGVIELLEDSGMNVRQARYLAAMKTSANLLLHHVNGVLSISRAEAGQLDLKVSEVDPRALLDELVESQRPLIEANGNRIRCDTGVAPDQIWVDPVRLRQVILNLVGNANKFTRGGDIVVECDRVSDGLTVEFRVSDTGIGIAEEDQERIFEEFRTLDTSYGRPAEGTGLGLTISRRLVQAMGGEMGVESEPGEGSIFWVRLPIGSLDNSAGHNEARGLAPLEALSKLAAPEPLTVLLVEDNEINRLVARDLLEQAGHSVVEARNGLEGVAAAERSRFDLILMDISMPELDGVSATARIRAGDGPCQATPIVALTAHALPEDLERFQAAGITDTLVKPLTKASLSRTLARLPGGERRTSATSVTTAQVLAGLAGRLGTGETERLLGGFCAEVDEVISLLGARPADAQARERQVALVHRAAGSAAILGCKELHGSLAEIENMLRAQGDSDLEPSITALRRLWDGTRPDARNLGGAGAAARP